MALAIAAGALVLVLSANAASLGRSVRARADIRFERAIESRLAEWRAGPERLPEGPMPGFAGHRWMIREAPQGIAGLQRLRRVTITVYGPDGKPVAERTEFVHGR